MTGKYKNETNIAPEQGTVEQDGLLDPLYRVLIFLMKMETTICGRVLSSQRPFAADSV